MYWREVSVCAPTGAMKAVSSRKAGTPSIGRIRLPRLGTGRRSAEVVPALSKRAMSRLAPPSSAILLILRPALERQRRGTRQRDVSPLVTGALAEGADAG